MIDHLNTFLYIWRVLFICTVVVASLFLLSFLLSSIETGSVQAKQTTSSTSADLSKSPNVLTSGMVRTANGLEQTTGSMAASLNSGIQSVTSAAIQGGKLAAHGTQTGITTAARGVGSGLTFVGRAVGRGIGFVIDVPSNAVKFVSNTSVASAVLRPSDHVEVPIIDPDSPELHAALAALPAAQESTQLAPQNDVGPAWPMHGRVTTEFGVAHWPYQRTHTGIDISDRQPSGVTPVKPFRLGRVIDTVHSRKGLGNHVIVDHGSGVTSVYAHLASISVGIGQEVALDTTLGFAGSTGVSTGTHLHFEIRVNGQAADPRQFISGHP